MATEKKIVSIPPIRVDERLEIALNRMANREDRKLSDYIRLVLARHAFGHAESVERGEGERTDFGALQSDAPQRRGDR